MIWQGRHSPSPHAPEALYFCDKVNELRWDLRYSSPSPEDPDVGTTKHGASNDVHNQHVKMCLGVIVIADWSVLEKK